VTADCFGDSPPEEGGLVMTSIKRLGAQEAREKCRAGAKLVCAYESDETFEKNHLEGAISFNQLKSLGSKVAKDDEIIFYCA